MASKALVTGLAAFALILILPAGTGAQPAQSDSSLSPEIQTELQKAGRYLKSGNTTKASPFISSALGSAVDVTTCLNIASFTESFGFPMMEVRRQCMRKALSLAKSPDDFMRIALKSRQYEFFEITRQCITGLIQGAKSESELYDLARKAQEISLNDVAHMAMEKIYSGIHSQADCLSFLKQAKLMGMDDLVRRGIKDLVDDEDNPRALCELLKGTEPLGMPDLNRYLLKKAIDEASTMEALKDIYDAANRNRELDIANLAAYRARKLKIINQIRADQEQDLSRQRGQTQSNSASEHAKRFSNGNTGAEGSATSGSGF